MQSSLPFDPRRIAIFRALHLGDLLLAVPAFRGIRRGFPRAEITLIGLPWAADFVDRFRHYLDRFLEFPGYPGLLEVDYDPARTRAFVADARAHQYDLAIQLHGSGQTSNPFVLDLGARWTVGYYLDRRPPGLSAGRPYPFDQPEPLRNAGLLDLLGLPVEDPRLEFPLDSRDVDAAVALLRRHGLLGKRLLGLHVGARPPARRWSPDRFAVVGDTLAEWFDLAVVLTGTSDERAIAEQVRSLMRMPAVNVAGQTDIGGLAALIDRLTLFVGNDTGPSHLAVARDVPSVTIFGPADRVRWGPLDQRRHRIVYRNVRCNPCTYWECPIDHRCLRWIEANAVVQAASDVLTQSDADQDTRNSSCVA